MRNLLRAVMRPAGGEVATCDEHLAYAMRQVTAPANGDDNDNHLIVRRLGEGSDQRCWTANNHPAAWVLIPQAVIR